VSRVIVESLAIGRALVVVAPVDAGGIDVVGAEDFAGGAVDDCGCGGVDEDDGGLAAVGVSDAEVVRAAGAAEGDFAAGVDVVEADMEVAAGAARGVRFGSGLVGGRRGCVRRGRGVDGAGYRGCGTGRAGLAGRARVAARGCLASPFFRVWWKRSILPWVCGWPGWPFFCWMCSVSSRYSKALRPPTKRAV
jgi:hypothetical protein